MEPAKHSPLVKKPDGSLKIAIGPTRWSPASPEANWLPLAPREAFSLTFHTYVPKEGRTHPPGTAAEGVEVWYCSRMALDTDKIDEAVLALLFLTRHDHWRAWKGFDWDALSRLYDKGLIADPVNKAKSVAFTEEGLKRAEVLFQAMFTKPD